MPKLIALLPISSTTTCTPFGCAPRHITGWHIITDAQMRRCASARSIGCTASFSAARDARHGAILLFSTATFNQTFTGISSMNNIFDTILIHHFVPLVPNSLASPETLAFLKHAASPHRRVVALSADIALGTTSRVSPFSLLPHFAALGCARGILHECLRMCDCTVLCLTLEFETLPDFLVSQSHDDPTRGRK
jgi:hypothetical protein